MCGIAGRVVLGGGKVSVKDITHMTSKIAHRGPDDAGVFISKDKRVGLGNRRLAIIDLSPKGHQPMFYKKGRYVITTNGEIYNFKEEATALAKLGYTFSSKCDTEVILALYDRYGEACLNHLRGMFAFCIYDSQEQTLFLARDRIGKKPLKYYFDGKIFIFASEVKAIISQKEIKRVPDFEAISKYLSYGYIPSPLTGFKDIKKLPPGHFMKLHIKTGKLIISRYWEPLFTEKLNLSEPEWCKKILSTLEEAVRLRMISDVPLGGFLSGGVDSSAVIATMARLSSRPVKTFTVTFKDTKWDESIYAQKIVKMYKTDHAQIPVGEQRIEILPEICSNFEEPFADGGVILSYIVSREARKHVTVILNGDGGDEIFAGYPNRYVRLKRDVDFLNYINLVRPTALVALKALNKAYKKAPTQRLTKYLEKSKLPLYQRFASYNQIFSPEELPNLTRGELALATQKVQTFSEVEECFRLFKGKDLKDAGLKFDLLYWLPDDLLAKADMTSMANSLEGRSPLLDTKMIELSGKIPFGLKVKNGETKYIFKKALEKIVPKDNLYRKKMGFGVPLHKWFAGKTKTYTKHIITNKSSQIKNLCDTRVISNMFSSHSEENDYGPKLFSLLTLEIWLRTYFD